MRHPSPPSSPLAVVLLPLIVTACGGQAATRSRDLRPADPSRLEARIARVRDGLLTATVVRGEPAHALGERLRHHAVPAVSVAVIDGGRVAWARAWGEVQAGGGVAADSTTLFQAASISKPVSAAAALRLVDRGTLSLDGDVNAQLRSWRVPDNRFTDSARVTLRRLLSHTAGTTVHGFPGYAAGAPLPTPVQVLAGAPPANTAPVVVDMVPGSGSRYSGGGYVVAQLLLTDATGRPFPELVRELVLAPAGMAHSTFAQPLPADREGQAATAHDRQGRPLPGRYHSYPELAAAGLWTTPSDLARFAIAIQRSLAGQAGAILAAPVARQMVTPQRGGYGLGFSVQGAADSLWFSHGGSNAGFESFLVASGSGGRGAVVMTNGEGGRELAMELLRSIAREYGWGILRPREREAVALTASELAPLAGVYRADLPGRPGGLAIDLRLVDGQLLADVPSVGWRGRALRAAAPLRFFLLESPGELAFERDAGGTVSAVVVTGLGSPVRAVRARE